MPFSHVCDNSNVDYCKRCSIFYSLGMSSSTTSIDTTDNPQVDVWHETDGKVSFTLDSTAAHNWWKISFTQTFNQMF